MNNEIELVIKMPQEMYDRILHSGVVSGSDTAYIGGAIIDGIELPSVHGDIKDIDEILVYKQQEVDILGKHILNEYVKTEYIKKIPAIISSNIKER